MKQYKITGHLGNVLSAFTDNKLAVNSGGRVSGYLAQISSSDYYPFGSLQPGRNFNAGDDRFGFNGKENDNEVKGTGKQQDYDMKIYDPRLGRFLSVDPLTAQYPWYTPYQFAGNTPIWAIDLDGLEQYYTSSGELIGKYGTSTEIRVVYDSYVSNAKVLATKTNITSETDAMNTDLYSNGSAPVFQNSDDAATDWAGRYNQTSIDKDREMSSDIFVLRIDGKAVITYEEPVVGDGFSVSNSLRPATISRIHAHAAYFPPMTIGNDQFSEDKTNPKGDINTYNNNINGYVSTPNGSLLKYDVLNKIITVLGANFAFDPSDPTSPTSAVANTEEPIMSATP